MTLVTLDRVLHHLTLWVPDLERATESWSWLLTQLGYVQGEPVDDILVFRHPDGFALALEQSADMVPGMLHSRFRPGLNHMAFRLGSVAALGELVTQASEHGWSLMPVDHHRIAGGADVAYLEDRDGFEVELVAPTTSGGRG